MRILDVSDGFTATGAPTAGDASGNSLQVYASDAAFVVANGTATAGDAYINSTDGLIHFYNGSAWKKITTQEGTAAHVAIFAVGGNLSSEATLAVARGGLNIASYTTGDLIYASAAGVLSKLGVGSNGQFLKLVAGLPAWGTGAISLGVLSKTANYTLLTTDDSVLADSSGGTFTLTLPTAVGNTGKIFYIKKTDSSFTAVSVATTSSQTIDGAASPTTLNTQNEALTLFSDGANWQILERRIPSAWTAYTPTIVGMGTTTAGNCRWRRVGDSLEVAANFTTGTPTAVEARLPFPTGLTSASTIIPTLQTAGQLQPDTASGTSACYPMLIEAAVTYFTFGVLTSAAAGLTKRNGSSLFGASQVLSILATSPINGWKG